MFSKMHTYKTKCMRLKRVLKPLCQPNIAVEWVQHLCLSTYSVDNLACESRKLDVLSMINGPQDQACVTYAARNVKRWRKWPPFFSFETLVLAKLAQAENWLLA